jgi:hypothetical protein
LEECPWEAGVLQHVARDEPVLLLHCPVQHHPVKTTLYKLRVFSLFVLHHLFRSSNGRNFYISHHRY